MPPKVFKDTTHGWLVVAGCSAAFFLFVGNASCLGLVEVELGSLFKDSGSSLSAINALYNGLGWGLAPVVAALTKFFSCRLALLLISVSGISNLASRFIMAGLASTSGQRRRLFLSVSFAMNAVSFLFFPLFSDILFLSVGAVLFGFSAGIFISITPPVLIDLFGVDKLPSTLGSNYLEIGTGYLLGGPLMRYLSLAMSAIDPVFYTSAGCTVMGLLLIMTVSCDGRNLARILKMSKRHFAPVSIPRVLPINPDGGAFTISYRKY